MKCIPSSRTSSRIPPRKISYITALSPPSTVYVQVFTPRSPTPMAPDMVDMRPRSLSIMITDVCYNCATNRFGENCESYI
mmetsp:Transcript_6764/g.8826  ORF Transcript_6764/g.8826 Transcript_6764/m.8826 type:complete len:80 (+) Transcript_6764:719-958(+)